MIAGMAGTGAERQYAYGGTKEEWPWTDPVLPTISPPPALASRNCAASARERTARTGVYNQASRDAGLPPLRPPPFQLRKIWVR